MFFPFLFQNSNGVLTDFLSFYTLPSTVMHHPAHKSLKAAYSFYNVHTETPLLDLMNDALIIAKMVGNAIAALFSFFFFLQKSEVGLNPHWFICFSKRSTTSKQVVIMFSLPVGTFCFSLILNRKVLKSTASAYSKLLCLPYSPRWLWGCTWHF